VCCARRKWCCAGFLNNSIGRCHCARVCSCVCSRQLKQLCVTPVGCGCCALESMEEREDVGCCPAPHKQHTLNDSPHRKTGSLNPSLHSTTITKVCPLTICRQHPALSLPVRHTLVICRACGSLRHSAKLPPDHLAIFALRHPAKVSCRHFRDSQVYSMPPETRQVLSSASIPRRLLPMGSTRATYCSSAGSACAPAMGNRVATL
jgi:hypothetical protein